MVVRRARRGHARPFPVATPYGTGPRLHVEAEIARRRWAPAPSPASADLLIVCGDLDDALGAAVQEVWDGMPGPRVRLDLPSGAERGAVTAALDDAVTALSTAPPRDDPGVLPPVQADAPAHGGVAMAGRADDRDGLRLDVLHVPLGPVLSDWPGGLVVETELQGDVIQAARVGVVGTGVAAPAEPYWDRPWPAVRDGGRATRGEAERRRAAAYLDGLGRLLAVAGWPWAASRARSLRDQALAGRPASVLVPAYARFELRVRRSRILRWMLHGIGTGLDGGSVLDRTGHRLAAAGDALGRIQDPAPLDPARPPRPETGDLAAMLTGSELAAARLIVAAVDPRTDLAGRRAAANG
ncbi:hypothetical protein [Spongiactinospora sp. TRM90649]|uniref:hypothetical protein n=1 Tax=Spongiactinospora sp. TRM90649 TaxID=3031114 RepID=UPI0023F8B2BA|nr:hypothetical protein [Spongiactinospora sp. TRM90649]MDF5752202.1 hypothetical protein [Spongiactinospora sp. TRM90649]